MIGFSNTTEINKGLHINSVSVMTRLLPSRVRQADGLRAARKQDQAPHVYNLFPDREPFYWEDDLIFQSEL